MNLKVGDAGNDDEVGKLSVSTFQRSRLMLYFEAKPYFG